MYDLVEASGERGVFAEGQVFGDARALHAVFDAGPCILHMEGGRPVHVYLADSRSSAGVAEIRVTEPLAW
ncbi:MAG: hypothetical protein ACRDQZ_03385 [Mycobacteriales bacterium]